MALDKCFQVSTVCTQTRPCLRPFASIEKNHFHLPTFQGFYKSPTSSLSSSAFPSSSFACSPKGRRYDKSRFIFFSFSVQEATDASWESNVIASKNPVLVEFWAPWCGPCRMIAPVIDELAKEHAGKISCYKVNTDDCPNIATRYGIRSIPTVLFFKNGEKKESVIGAVPKSTLSATIEKYVDA